MKRLSILLGIAVSFVAPLAAHAEQTTLLADTTAPQARPKADRVQVKAAAPHKADRVWYEITNITAAGSHLPVVICHHGALMYVLGGGFTPGKVYRREKGAVEVTGAPGVGNLLLGLDPAILTINTSAR